MSVFPFMSNEPLPVENEELPVFKEYAYDFKKNCFKLRGGNTYLVEKNEALRIWIFKALATERFHYLAYSADFGCEVHELIGQNINQDITFSEIRRFIVEALMCNPYIEELSNFKFMHEGSYVEVCFDCTTIYGTMPLSFEQKEV